MACFVVASLLLGICHIGMSLQDSSPHSHLQITEVMPRSNMTGGYTKLPWVEVTNFGRKVWNLTNSVIKFSPEDPATFRIYSHILLDSYETAVIHGGLDDLQASDEIRGAWELPDHVLVIGTQEFTPSSTSGLIHQANTTVSILDSQGALVSNVSWELAVPVGVSLQFSMHGEPLGLSTINVRGAWASSLAPNSDIGSPGLFTAAAADIVPGRPGSFPHGAVSYGRHSVFAATSTEGLGVELHRSDALNAPERIADTWRFNGSSNPQGLVEYNRAVYFSAQTPIHGREMWVYRGMDTTYFSPFEPELVADLLPGGASSDPRFMTVFDGGLYFTALGPSGRRELYFFDDDAANTEGPVNLDASDHLVLPEGPGFEDPQHLFTFHSPTDSIQGTGAGHLVFTAHTVTHGREIYVLDPGSTQPRMLADVCPGACSSDARDWFEHNGVLYFSADDGTHGREVWKYDGGFDVVGPAVLSSGQMGLVQDLEAGAGGSEPSDFTAWAGQLVFIATTSVFGRELFIVDLQSKVQLLTEALPGAASGEMESLLRYNGKLFATAIDSAGRRELYVWDGQERIRPVFFRPPRGTSAEGSILSGAQLWTGLDELLWVADDGASGQEIHKLYSRPDEGLNSCALDMRQFHFIVDPVNVATMQLSSQASCAVKLTLDGCAGCRLGETVVMDDRDPGGHFIVASAGNGVDAAGAVHVWGRRPYLGRAGRGAAFSWVHTQALDITHALPAADPNARCGASLSLSMSNLLVGCPGYSNGTGLVLLFELTRRLQWEHTWTFQSPEIHGEFGSAVSFDGQWAVIGAPTVRLPQYASVGKAFIFKLERASWQLNTVISALFPESLARLGHSVAVRGSNVVVAAPGWGGGSGRVHIYIYESASQRWMMPTQPFLTAPDGTTGSAFGQSIALSTNHLAVSAPMDSTAGARAGAAWVYYFADLLTFYVPQDKLVPHDAIPGDMVSRGGVSVTSSPPQVLVAGAVGDAAVAGSGAYTFARQNRQDHWWQQAAKVRPQDTDSSDEFGAAVAIASAVGVVSAPGDDTMGVDAGALYFIVPSNACLRFATLPWDTLFDNTGKSYLGGTFMCTAGQFEADAVVVGTSGSCSPCSNGPCAEGYFEQTQCTAKRDRTCTLCSPPCTAGMVETQPCATEHDRQCSTLGSAEAQRLAAGGRESCLLHGLCEELPPAVRGSTPHRTPTLQRLALTTLHTSLRGEQWRIKWDTRAMRDPCVHKWHGVLCDGDLNIVGLRLRQLGASGVLPASFGEHLAFMRSVDLSGNHISGLLPQSIAKMTLLRELRLGANFFSGAFPLWLNNMTHLFELDLTNIPMFKELTCDPQQSLDSLRNASAVVHIDQITIAALA